jgi:DNA polymerase
MGGKDDDPPSKQDIDGCRRCELWKPATQGVAGEGRLGARLMLVGEQPGNDEDLAGRPFVGPAGLLLRALLDEAGLPATEVFITNAVKHFYFQLRGKRRIHKTPLQRHVAACHDWLERELAQVKPDVVVTLGATALAAVLGRRITIVEARAATPQLPSGTPVVATYHPSAVLRAPDGSVRSQLRATLLADLKRAKRVARRDDA